MDWVVLLIFVAFFGAFGWLIWSSVKATRRRQAEVDAMVQAEGWTASRNQEGRQPVVRIEPPMGDWSLRVGYPFRRSSGKTSSSNPGSTEFRAKTPNWPGGRVVFMQRMPGGMGFPAGGLGSGVAGFLQNSLVKAFLSKVVPAEILADLDRLKPWDAPPGIELMILATEDPREGNLAAVHEVVNRWRPVRSRDGGAPSVSIGPEGITVRLGTCLPEAEDMKSFVEMARRLATDLS
jgi:hypothetical protein